MFLFMLSYQAWSTSCSCITKESTKEYQKNSYTWYGTTAHFSCRYVCTNPKGKTEEIQGFHKKTIVGDERGNEIVCDGTQYKEVHSPVDHWAYWNYEGNIAFNPVNSKSVTLREWAKNQNCP